jgi:DNA primase
LKSGNKAPTKKTRMGSGSDIRTREKPSVVAQAMIWLLQYPKLAQGVGDLEQISSLDRPGIPLLVNLLHLLQDQPELTPAAVVERFRGEAHHRHLQKLLVWEHTLSEQDVEQEFAGSIRQFRRESMRMRKQELERKPLKQWDQRDRQEHQQLSKQMSELEQTAESEQT